MRQNNATPVRGVVGAARSGSAFTLDRRGPSAAAARYVDHYWIVRGDLRGQEPFDSTVITFPAVNLTREWGTNAHRHGHTLPAVPAHGVVDRAFRTINGTGAVVGARFHPVGFTARFGSDAGSLTGRVVRAENLMPDAPLDVDGSVHAFEADIAPEAPVDETYLKLRPLVNRMTDHDRLQRVEQVMRLSPWSARKAQRVFGRYVGVPVTWVLCRYRLQHAALEIETNRGVDFADLAVRLGWYDQPHFISDFRTMLGCTPGEYGARTRAG
ncbi:MAG: AraC family transcriptional regulator [Mycobacterium sp.]|jgi:AraC-like DNA-binding protein|nr:AraC family transcriptional regulator [Mycobacterium sp.]